MKISGKKSGRLRLAAVILLGLVCAGALLLSPAMAQTARPGVLILASYHQGDAWTDSEIAGVLDELQAQLPGILPDIEYLDARRNPQQIPLETAHLEDKFRDHPLDLVIVLDDPALDLALQKRQELFPGVPVVFAGINNFNPQVLAGQQKITGVMENLDIATTLQLAMALQPGLKRVYAIQDGSTSGRLMRQQMEALAPLFAGKLEVQYAPAVPLEKLTEELAHLPGDSMALILTYVTDTGGKTFSREESTRLIASASPVPVYAMQEARLGHGILGGALLEGREHGRQAARLGLRVLNGEPFSSLPVEQSVSRAMLDYTQLARFSIPVSRWPSWAQVINRPLSFWERYQLVLEPAFVLIGALIVAIFLLAEASLRLLEYREAERNGRLLSEALRDSAAGLNSTLSLEQVLDRILVNVRQILPHDAANLMLIDLPGLAVHVERSRGYERLGPAFQETVRELKFPLDQFKNLHEIYETGEPYIVPDTRSDPEWVVVPESAWVKSYIGAPVIINDQVVGFVNLDSAAPGRFSPDDARILSIFAGQAATAIRNAQLYEQAQQEIAERRRAEALLRQQRDLSQALAASGSVEAAGQALLEAAVHIEGIDCGGLYLVDASSGDFVLAVHHGLSAEFVAQAGRYDREMVEARLAQSQPVYGSYSRLRVNRSPVMEQEGLRAVAFTPITFQGNTLAVLNLGSHSLDQFPEGSRSLFEAISAQFGQVLARLQAEAALRDSEERFRLAFQTSPDAISISHLESGEFVEVNDFYCRLSGYSRQELLGKNGLELNLWAEPSQRRELLQTLAQRGSVENVELSGLKKDGSVVSLLASACILQLYGAPHLLMISRDITERKQAEAERLDLERRLLHAQKLESLGVLAGGIAHDFNNLLLAMLGNLELAQEKLSAGDRARLSVEQAIHAAQRAADLTRQLLAYSGRGQFIVHPLDLSRLVEENVHLFRAVLSKSTSLSLALHNPLPAVMADTAQLQQVVMNLLTNAAEALQDGKGEITLSTGVQDCIPADLAHSRLDERPPAGRFVFLQVMDTGVGMDAEMLSRLFEPFFTTKVAGRGLGMSAVLGIVRGHQGAIFVDSTPGCGTCVRVLFPACDAPVQEPGPSLAPAAARPTETAQKPLKGCVLVVDDERIVRQVCTDLLEFFGFSVIAADDGQAGVDALQAHAGQVDLVLLDLSMPRLGGLEAFHLMREIAPQVPVVLSSGFDEKEALRQFAGEGLAGFIQKPYTMENLRSKVAQAIQHQTNPDLR